jgi:hypothetical protein
MLKRVHTTLANWWLIPTDMHGPQYNAAVEGHLELGTPRTSKEFYLFSE